MQLQPKSNKITKQIVLLALIGIAALILALLLSGACFSCEDAPEEDTTEVIVIDDPTLKRVIEADTEEERIRGLSFRESLDKNTGMLFIFDTAAAHGLWMKDMYFPIDIFWLDEEYVIVDIQAEVLPESYPEVFYPSSPARYVLETNVGFADTKGFEIGDSLEEKLIQVVRVE